MDAIIRSTSLAQETRQLRRAPNRQAGEGTAGAEKAVSPVAAGSGGAAVPPVASGNPGANAQVGAKPVSAGTPANAATTAAKPSLFVKPNMVAAEKKNEAVAEQSAEQKLRAELELVQSAKRKVEQELSAIRLRSDEELAALREQAEQRGYAQGQEKGEAAAKAQLQEQIERLKAVTSQLLASKDSMMTDAEDTMVEIVFAAICRLVGEAAANRSTILHYVRQCVGETRSPEQVTVRLHPSDLALLHITGEPNQVELDPQMRLLADASIALGGCIVDSATGSLDARLETQLGHLRDALLEVRAERRLAGEDL